MEETSVSEEFQPPTLSPAEPVPVSQEIEETSAIASEEFQAPAISPAEPVPPSENSKPYPTPFSCENPLFSGNNTGEDVREKFLLRKVRNGRNKIHKRKQKFKMFKGPAAPIPKEERKDLVNAKLRRVIFPKPPVWILRELAMELNTEEVYSYSDPVDEVVDGQTMKLFPCEVQIQGGTYYGSAPDQEISQMLAAENAIQGLTASAVTAGPPNAETSDPLDNAPWAALASLGLFKLFNDWQNRGFGLPLNTVPAAITPGRVVDQESNVVRKACKNMPEYPTTKHPVSLLNEVYPGTTMTSSVNQESNLFEMTVSLEGRTFVATGRSKKDAKKLCAMEALKELLNIDYSDTS